MVIIPMISNFFSLFGIDIPAILEESGFLKLTERVDRNGKKMDLIMGWGVFQYYDMFSWDGFWRYVDDSLWSTFLYVSMPWVIPTLYLFKLLSGEMKWD
jgi:hypothetical protein